MNKSPENKKDEKIIEEDFKLKYQPNWLQIIFLSITFHLILLTTIFFLLPDEKNEKENSVQEVEWIEADLTENFLQESLENTGENVVEKIAEKNPKTFEFPEIKMPAEFEPPAKILPPVAPVVESVKPAKIPQKKVDDKTEKTAEEKIPVEDTNEKLKVFVKVFPKDIVNQLIESGTLSEKPIFSEGKIILEVNVGKGGNVEKVSVIKGGSNEINILSESAASGWVFVPFLDENGKAKETKTKIEFKPEDF